MTAIVVRIAALTAIYLAVLSSLHPADIVIGALLSTVLVAVGARIRGPGRRPEAPPGTTPWGRLAGVPALIGFTVLDMCRGSWTVARHCLGRPTTPGYVSMPIERHRPATATAWAIRVGLSPDTVVVDVDDEHGTLVLHVLDVRDPDAVRRDQVASYERAQRRVFP
ncbi:Na+/H+ antiporter subunit E [Mycolicibacterium flavescens]|uniref:Sodium:proton antiporter n=1 Tax=Mycolicibacterium flavescens TaxID=1776 RepID=A0A1E3RCL9_MYCFV|nr:Na+/H+ antiporter subunit E [Mycolicibacterium flavescens]MCV7280107.1 Na+/H+ antiporter subunit E [Mycolicibacterium flavescens]ODQ87628.1 sodium:proton antiporter [Mycolicibacterium flavescens]